MLRPKVKTKDSAVVELRLNILTEFRNYLKIDKDALSEAMAEQADLFFRVGDACANANSEREEAKEHLSTVDSELGQSFRGGKKKDDLKITEGSVKDLIQTNQRHQEAFEVYLEAKKRAEQLVALRDAFQERGRMLRDLGNLYATGYFTVTASKGAAADIGREQLARVRITRGGHSD